MTIFRTNLEHIDNTNTIMIKIRKCFALDEDKLVIKLQQLTNIKSWVFVTSWSQL